MLRAMSTMKMKLPPSPSDNLARDLNLHYHLRSSSPRTQLTARSYSIIERTSSPYRRSAAGINLHLHRRLLHTASIASGYPSQLICVTIMTVLRVHHRLRLGQLGRPTNAHVQWRLVAEPSRRYSNRRILWTFIHSSR